MNDHRDNRTTVERDVVRIEEAPGSSSEPRATVVVYAHDDTRLIELRESENVLVGRAPPADVVVDDMTLSRRHARFSYADGAVHVEDLGSRNGTLVRGARVSSARLRSGDDVQLGGVAISIHLRKAEQPPLGIESYDELTGRLESEILRARTFGHQFALVAVYAPERSDPVASAARHVSRWAPQVREELRPVDAIAVYGPQSVLVLMPESSQGHAERIARRLTRVGGPTRLFCGVVMFPETADNPGELVSAAYTAARGAHAEDPVGVARGKGSDEESEAPVVRAESMRQLHELVERVAVNNVPVLILGETGTGKEVIARAVHRCSPRAKKTMTVVNCAALPSNLIESALFGHEKGAFTGADQAKKGVFEAGHEGTVFLDEVGELSPEAQAALLRVLETKSFSRVGSSKEIEVDVRIIAATHRDLESMVEEGTFRADLLYRLNTMTIKVPPLCERAEEVAPLALEFLQKAATRWSTGARQLSDTTMQLLQSYRWPGNVRELRNVIERAAVICSTDTIEAEDLPERLRGAKAEEPSPEDSARPTSLTYPAPDAADDASFKDRIRDYEVALITNALESAEGNQSRAAEILKMPLRTLVHKIKTYGLRKSYKK